MALVGVLLLLGLTATAIATPEEAVPPAQKLPDHPSSNAGAIDGGVVMGGFGGPVVAYHSTEGRWYSRAVFTPDGVYHPDELADDEVAALQERTFGAEMDFEGGTLVVKEFETTHGFIPPLHVYRRIANEWVREAKIVGPRGRFAVDDSTLIVLGTDDEAFVYHRQGGAWGQITSIPRPADVIDEPYTIDSYGFRVDLSGDTYIVGAPGQTSHRGAVYVFERSGNQWVQVQKLVGPVPGGGFGEALSITGNTIAVGARMADGRGAVFIYERTGSGWVLRKRLNGPRYGEYFGDELAVANGTLVVYADGGYHQGTIDPALYVYRGSGSTWMRVMLLDDPFPHSDPDFDTNGPLVVLGRQVYRVAPAPHYCEGRRVTILGTKGADSIDGTPQADVILGRDGDDVIDGGRGDDTICGGSGDDQLIGDLGRDTLSGGPGRDLVNGGRDDDTAFGDTGRDQILGGTGDDDLLGGVGNDRFRAGPGDDHVLGGGDTDGLIYSAASSVEVSLVDGIATGEGSDTMTGIETLVGSRFDDTLTGDNGPNRIVGSTGSDRLEGLGQEDILIGGPGDDDLDGGSGSTFHDTLRGGPGRDRCVNGWALYSCELPL